jgi:8-oxo-dGTP diphosphatase
MSDEPAHSNENRPRTRRGAIGILERDGRYLAIRRAPQLIKGGSWCFPGGHVEPGENARQAVRRELQEELGVDVVVTERLGSIRVDAGRYVLVVWRVTSNAQSFHPNENEIAEWRWLTPSELRSIKPGLPSNERVLELLGD